MIYLVALLIGVILGLGYKFYELQTKYTQLLEEVRSNEHIAKLALSLSQTSGVSFDEAVTSITRAYNARLETRLRQGRFHR